MSVEVSLQEYAEELQAEIDDQSASPEGSGYWLNTFTRVMIERLEGLGVLDGGVDCYHKSRGIEVHGYHLNEDDRRLDLFTCITMNGAPPPVLTKDQIETAFKRLASFLHKCFDGTVHTSVEQSSELVPVARRIHQLQNTIEKIRLFLFTNGQMRTRYTPTVANPGSRLKHIEFVCDIWDIVRLHKHETSGAQAEPIEIDLQKQFGKTLPCLIAPAAEGDCRVYLTCIPGDMLASLYDAHGMRLLERNVRAFLQVRGKVNQGIRRTVLHEPQRFLAYNNGISAVADSVTIKELGGGNAIITHIQNLQIVNGGQTTATLHHTKKKDAAKLDGIAVQAKLTVVPPVAVNTVVPLISQYANSQNKVSEADFAANEVFHVRIEKLSRSVVTPANPNVPETHWFYERVRGQYLYDQGRQGTAKRKKTFKELNPVGQRFSKTDLGKFINSWNQMPQVVSYGAQKSFLQFMTATKAEPAWGDVDQDDFKRIVALAILFKRIDQLVQGLDLGGYKANIVTYTLAYLSHATGAKLDLDRIWKDQKLTAATESAINKAAREIQKVLIAAPDGKNIGEWCKERRCWDKVKELEVKFGKTFDEELAQKTIRIPAKAVPPGENGAAPKKVGKKKAGSAAN